MADKNCSECGGYGSIFDRYYGLSAWRLCPKCNGGWAELLKPDPPPDAGVIIRQQANELKGTEKRWHVNK